MKQLYLTYDESFTTDFIIDIIIMNKYYERIKNKQYECSNGKVEIDYNLNDETISAIEIVLRTKDDHYSIAAYKINHSKNCSLNFQNDLKRVTI